VGENKRLKKQIASLQAQVNEHHIKIAKELEKPQPDQADIEGWKKEIRGWDRQIEKKRRRLRDKRR
jgi:peptidoglycan hydrolase CwlO-like protein